MEKVGQIEAIWIALLLCVVGYTGCNMDDSPAEQPPQAVIEKTTPEGLRATATAGRETTFVYDSADTFTCYRLITDGGWIVEERRWPEMDGKALPAPEPDLHATATAGLKALAEMSPLQAAGVLTASGFGSTAWKWTAPTEGAPVDHYRVEMHFTVRDTFFRYWFPSWAECVDDTVIVAGVDAAKRVGPESLPGVCE